MRGLLQVQSFWYDSVVQNESNTMKQYTKPLRITRLPKHTNESLTCNRDGKAAKRGTAGGFSIGTLTNTHILTSPWTEQHDRLLSIYYEEWALWIKDYEQRKQTRPNNEPFTLIENTEAENM